MPHAEQCNRLLDSVWILIFVFHILFILKFNHVFTFWFNPQQLFLILHLDHKGSKGEQVTDLQLEARAFELCSRRNLQQQNI